MNANSSTLASMTFFVKCLENHRTEEYVKNVVQDKLKYGTVDSVTFIPRIDQHGNARYKAAVVRMNTWNAEHDATHALFQRTARPGSATKVFFQHDKYWFVAQYTPEHTTAAQQQQQQQQYNAAVGFEHNADVADQAMTNIQQGMPLRTAILHAAKLAQEQDTQEQVELRTQFIQQEHAHEIDRIEKTHCREIQRAEFELKRLQQILLERDQERDDQIINAQEQLMQETGEIWFDTGVGGAGNKMEAPIR